MARRRRERTGAPSSERFSRRASLRQILARTTRPALRGAVRVLLTGDVVDERADLACRVGERLDAERPVLASLVGSPVAETDRRARPLQRAHDLVGRQRRRELQRNIEIAPLWD